MNTLKRMSKRISKHHGMFFWISAVYMCTVLGIGGLLDAQDQIIGILLFPINLLTWSVFLAVLHSRKTYPIAVLRVALAMVAISTVAPIIYIL